MCKPITVSTRALIGAALENNRETLKTALDNWVPTKSIERSKTKRPANSKAYGQDRAPASSENAYFKKTQDLFHKNRKALANHILEGSSWEDKKIYPEIQAVDQLYRGILEDPAAQDDKPITPRSMPNDTTPFITEEEILAAKNNWRNAAPGPDGILVSQVKQTSDADLAILFNVILQYGTPPTKWRTLRTTLIEKGGDTSNPSNWRPITIGSAVQRLFHRVLENRLKKSLSNGNQRGFTNNDGVLANCLLLNTFIETKRAKTKPYTVVALDITKAFDSVGHSSIKRSLSRMGVDAPISKYIMMDLSTSQTVIKVDNQQTNPIQIRRGVKQGDPLSPTIFNMVIEELLDQLDEGNITATIQDRTFRVPVLAFADDLILLFDSEAEAQIKLNAVEKFLAERGMKINSKKSRCTSVRVKQKADKPLQTFPHH